MLLRAWTLSNPAPSVTSPILPSTSAMTLSGKGWRFLPSISLCVLLRSNSSNEPLPHPILTPATLFQTKVSTSTETQTPPSPARWPPLSTLLPPPHRHSCGDWPRILFPLPIMKSGKHIRSSLSWHRTGTMKCFTAAPALFVDSIQNQQPPSLESRRAHSYIMGTQVLLLDRAVIVFTWALQPLGHVQRSCSTIWLDWKTRL